MAYASAHFVCWGARQDSAEAAQFARLMQVTAYPFLAALGPEAQPSTSDALGSHPMDAAQRLRVLARLQGALEPPRRRSCSRCCRRPPRRRRPFSRRRGGGRRWRQRPLQRPVACARSRTPRWRRPWPRTGGGRRLPRLRRAMPLLRCRLRSTLHEPLGAASRCSRLAARQCRAALPLPTLASARMRCMCVCMWRGTRVATLGPANTCCALGDSVVRLQAERSSRATGVTG